MQLFPFHLTIAFLIHLGVVQTGSKAGAYAEWKNAAIRGQQPFSAARSRTFCFCRKSSHRFGGFRTDSVRFKLHTFYANFE